MDELDLYNYDFDESLIAQKPANPRDSCRLMVVDDKVHHKKFRDILSYFKKGDVLVLNSSKVAHAKLLGHKKGGSPAEIILTQKFSDTLYECRIKTNRPRIGQHIIFSDKSTAKIVKLVGDTFTIELSAPAIIATATLPTPPYIATPIKDEDYQTVYSNQIGSLAAPTAGLHFTHALLEEIRKLGVQVCYITLHVSFGTFKSIDSGIAGHTMDPEKYEVTTEVADCINSRKGRLFVVGTTTLKTLETVSSRKGIIYPGIGESKLFIHPPFEFLSKTDCLITNFHLPESTLILLTCAFAGRERLLDAYKIAVEKKYAFYSLGDAMLLWKK
jgi:S-adenosylmethionine:tRNA ribosyltransferase-isomerase